MYYNYNQSSLITGYIKELLKDFNFYQYPVYKDDSVLYKDRVYIKDGSLQRCLNPSSKTFRKIGLFKPEINYLNSCKNLLINSTSYDKYTHFRLGDYLRFIKDYNKVNLMSLYNCFEPTSVLKNVNTSITTTGYPIIINTDDQKNNYYVIPVKLNTDYTIAIDSNDRYEMFCMVYSDDGVFSIDRLNSQLIQSTYKTINGSLFSRPSLFSTKVSDTLGNQLWKFENNLKLIIKLPTRNKSTITILEGDFRNYSNNCSEYFTVKQARPEDMAIKESGVSLLPNSKLSLLSISTGKSYPFADRLVEYLLGMAISPLDEIGNNIGSVQSTVYKKSGKPFKGVNGIWIDDLSYRLIDQQQFGNVSPLSTFVAQKVDAAGQLVDDYQLTRKLGISDTKYDILSYADKDTQQLLHI